MKPMAFRHDSINSRNLDDRGFELNITPPK
jgi:hypothetical protein